jgi:aspartyl-tRNA synthetase (EC 6.1.1.12)
MDTLSGLKRTHYCGSLRDRNIGEEVVLMGWVQRKRILAV